MITYTMQLHTPCTCVRSAAGCMHAGFAAAGTTSSVRPAQPGENPSRLRLAVVGDVHDQWDAERDAAALHALGVDVAVFVGDFANENADFVGRIAALDFPKAVRLSHATPCGTSAPRTRTCPFPPPLHSCVAPFGFADAAPARQGGSIGQATCHCTALHARHPHAARFGTAVLGSSKRTAHLPEPLAAATGGHAANDC